jgi:hypothetical protein
MNAIKRLLAVKIRTDLDEDTKGGLLLLAWFAWVIVMANVAEHFGWVTP